MRDAAADADVPAGTAFNYRFIPAIRYAKGLIEDGELGEIRQVRGRYLQDWLVDPEAPWAWRMDADTAGSGALGDLGAHTLDLADFLVGDEVGEIDRVSGHLQTFVDERPVYDEAGDVEEYRDVTVDDAYTAQVAYESGAMGSFEATRFAEGHKNDHAIEIHGSKGSLKFSLERLNELEVLREDDRGYQTVLVTDERPTRTSTTGGRRVTSSAGSTRSSTRTTSSSRRSPRAASSSRRSNRGTRCKNSSTRSNAPTSAGSGCRWSSACRAVSNAGRAKWVPAGATLNRRVFAVVRTERLVRVERDGFPDDLEILVPGGVGYGHPIARLHDAVAGPRAELHRLVRVLAADVQLFGRNWFGTGRDDHEVCPLRLDLELRVRGRNAVDQPKTAAPTSANSTTTMPTSIPEPAIGVNPVRRSGTRTFAFPSARGRYKALRAVYQTR